ncbi:DUF3768 domain-containing protein [Ancylobacter aquaticus]|uniref:DUF3768 domain-containing protein n=1 Tax=Ancylobacter aquaticus TaxID=100 RepID=UPI001FE19064|nr:DUF3768 domain-containing protein [Ancylobacter aquaticus]
MTKSAGCPGRAFKGNVRPTYAIARVRHHDDFSPDNDPHDERDFGAIGLEGLGRVFWKIDYYDPTLTLGSEDSADPARTRRVLTIMLAKEY